MIQSRRLKYFLFLSLAFISLGKCYAYSSPLINQEASFMEVSAKASQNFKADLAYINFSIKNLSNTVSEANTINEQESKKIISVLRKHRINSKNIEIQNYRVRPNKEYNHRTKKSELKGYEANKSYKVKIQDLSKLDLIVASISDSDYSEINNVFYDLSDREKAKLEVYKLATRNAVNKAKTIVAEIPSIKLSRIHRIKDSFSDFVKPVYKHRSNSLRLMASSASADEENSFTNKDIKITSEISISYFLESAE